MLYPNKWSKRFEKVKGEEDLQVLNRIFTNHNHAFENYLKDRDDVPVGESAEMKNLALGVAWFSDKFKRDGIHYFGNKSGKSV